MSSHLIGREREQGELLEALNAARQGAGGMVLLAGEAGVGKTTLARHCLACDGALFLQGNASETAAAPYAPIAAVLRAYGRSANGAADFVDCGSLRNYLTLLLPELGSPPDAVDPGTLLEAMRCAFTTIAGRQATVIFLDDLHWADNATLDLLPALAHALSAQPLLIVAAYRSDEVTRDHRLRRLRHELRRLGLGREITLRPFSRAQTGELAARVLDRPLSPRLASALHKQSRGIPLFVEELALAVQAAGATRPVPATSHVSDDTLIPLPESVHDAVLSRLNGLSAEAERALEIAAVLGSRVDLALIAELIGGDEGLAELFERRLILEDEPGCAIFRHSLTRATIYEAIGWPRRRALHRQIGAALRARGAPAELVAEHWLLGGRVEEALQTLQAAMDNSCRVHAYGDAVRLAERALEMMPDGGHEAQRTIILERLARSAQRCGLLEKAIDAWQEIARRQRLADNVPQFAGTQRRLATVFELQGDPLKAQAARRRAAEAFAHSGFPAEAAAERLAIVLHLQSEELLPAALEQLALGEQEAMQAAHGELQARIQGVKAALLARSGNIQAGCQLAQSALSLALEQNLSGVVAEVYGHLGTVLEQTAHHAPAPDTYLTAVNCCEGQGAGNKQPVCLAHLAMALKQAGEWRQATAICRDMLAADTTPRWARAVVSAVLGFIYVYQGDARARPLLREAAGEAARSQVAALEVTCAWALAVADRLDGADVSAAEHCRFILARQRQVHDYHIAVPALRWAATFFASHEAADDLHACVAALSGIVGGNDTALALAGLAHALGEVALLDGDPQTAAAQFGQALALLEGLALPLDQVETRLRAAAARAAAGERESAVKHAVQAYHEAQRLGARPLARQAGRQLEALGESLKVHLGLKAFYQLKRGGLTERQFEVLQLLATGQTNREIAQQLVLSRRTVDMHVRHILAKLDCHSRTEAVHRATQLGLL